MNTENSSIDIQFLDHVAIRVKDLHASIKWYQEVLGLKKYQLPEWGDFPVFMMSGKSGIALFPAKMDDPKLDFSPSHVKIDHFAFHVDQENFKKAKKRYQELGLEFNVQDHHYFHSIYTKDLDGHMVELTTLVVEASEFYKL